jgi:chorismate mutase
MDQQSKPLPTLDEIRQRIDEIDSGLLDLLQQRFAASRTVRQIKSAAGGTVGSPIRAAREAVILRALLQRAGDDLPHALIIRLWREIMTSSTLVQADASVCVTSACFLDADIRTMLAGHFGLMPVREHASPEAIVEVLREDPAAVAAFAIEEDWLPALDGSNGLSVIATLPFLAAGDAPRVVVIGQPFEETTGSDETLIVTNGRLPRDFAPAPLWSTPTCNGCYLSGLPGFLDASEMPLAGLQQGNVSLALRVVGRYPSPLKV